jgi:organic radical activating enzyme
MTNPIQTVGHKLPFNSEDGLHLPLMEMFYSIQGEGFHQGKAASFIRLAGCDVGCIWCDVKESWDAEPYDWVEINKIYNVSASNESRIAIITGGEPAMYNLGPLTGLLKKNQFKTHLETSGVYPITGEWDWICFSPKKFKEPSNDIFGVADELKVIVYHPSDLEWGEKLSGKVQKDCKLYFQPEWSKSEVILPKIIEYVKANPHWEISLQIHKFMNIP